MWKTLRHYLLPHKTNNQRARLIHNEIIFVVILFLLGGGFLISTTRQHFSNVLGISVDISAQDLLSLTNQKRAEAGLSPLALNAELAQAAEGKAQDMFAKQYWAHFAPDGKSPWDFIRGAGYNYIYAGENLARGFTTTNDVINAWMASPDHRANMLSIHYNDVGFAVERGPLPGDSDTVLVVEEFGSRTLNNPTAKAPPVVALPEKAVAENITGTPTPTVSTTPTPTPIPPVLATVKRQPLIDSAFITKGVSLSLLSLFLIVFALDLILTEQRQTVRMAGHSFDHLIFLIAILVIAISLGVGIIV